MTAKLNFWSALFLLLPALVLTFGCKDENLDIQDSKDRLDVLEGTTIKSINEQIFAINTSISDLEETDKALDAYIKELEAGLSANNDTLTKLKHADEALDRKITDLQTYVDTELTTITDWADATFVTIEQYSVVQTEISAIKTLIDKTKSDITEEYTTAIETAISNSETGMKEWVNSELTKSYYTISDVDGKVSALEALISDGDTNLQNQINEQKAALQQAKADLTNEYKQYINQAIASGGIIDQAIASQVRKAQDALQTQIDVINERLDSLEDRLGKLEEDFVNRIQSLKYIPEYSNRKVMVSDIFRMEVSLDFLVTPSSQAEAVKKAWEANSNILSSYLRYTKAPETKSISPAIPLEVTSVSIHESGVLNITMRETDENPVDADYWCKNFEGIIYVQVSDGNSDIISDFVDVETQYDDISLVKDAELFKNLSPVSDGAHKSANCYIVSNVGLYRFKICKGNGIELAGSKSDIHPEGKPAFAEVLWESDVANSGVLIKNVKYDNEYIYFRTTETFTQGNAIVALKDDFGKILWSWHIWSTEEPHEQVYKNNAGIMMDRNIGATSSDNRGFLFQWGRKDPFTRYNSEQSVAKTETTGTIIYSIMHPTSFITSPEFYADWCVGDSESLETRWDDNNKTIYDPCPYGWRVPNAQIWDSYSYNTKYDYFGDEGLRFEIDNSKYAWYPIVGIISSESGGWTSQYGYAGYHSGKSDKYLGFRSWTSSTSYVPIGCHANATGRAVRCQKE